VSPLLAQPVQPAYPPPYPDAYPNAYPNSYPGPQPGYFGALPPREIVAIVRAKGLDPLSRPMRQGPVYGLRALDPSGREMQVFVDARGGRILRVVPTMRLGGVSPPYPIPPGRMVPDGNSPNSRISGAPGLGDDMLPGERISAPAGTPPGLPGAASAPAPRTAARAPLPRPRPNMEAAGEPTPVPGASASANPSPALFEE
jgi:hypothetical protein